MCPVIRFVASAAATALAVAGCSQTQSELQADDVTVTPEVVTEAPPLTPEPEEPPAVGSVEPNDVDVNFAQMMIGHHEQAIILVKIAEERSTSAELLELAEEIAAAQGPEIELMQSWVLAWGYDLFTYEEHKDHEMPGMLTEEELAEVADADRDDFDRMWLDAMILHHEGAIVMAADQLEGGVVPEAHELSHEIIDAQQAEIDYMRDLIERL